MNSLPINREKAFTERGEKGTFPGSQQIDLNIEKTCNHDKYNGFLSQK